MPRFAEKIHFKFTMDKNYRHTINTDWSTGFFVGINGKTTEYLVATEEGIFSCATIRRLPDDEAYDPKCIQLVNITYRVYFLRARDHRQWESDSETPTARTQSLSQ